MGSSSVPLCEPTRLLTWSTSPTRRLPRTYWPFRSPTQRRTPTGGSTAASNSVGSPMTNFALRAPSGYLIGAIGVVGALSPDAHSAEFGYWLAQSYRGHGLMPRVSVHSATTHFKSSEFIGFLLRLSPPTLLRTAHWRRRGFNAKGYSDITTSSKAYTSMQLSMGAFLTPVEMPNRSMKPTAQLCRLI